MKTLLDNLDVPFRFESRRTPLAGDLRPAWRVSLVLLMLLHSRGRKATLQKLHVLNSVCRSEATRAQFLRYLDGRARKDQIIPRIEPSLNRAVKFARGEGLVEVEQGKNLKLTEDGLKAAQQVDQEGDCLAEENAFLKRVQPSMTEGRIDDLFTWNISL